jgi:ribonuclease HI
MITIYFDGLCEKNPGGIATYAYIIYKDDEQIKTGCNVVGEGEGMTSNVAEYFALLKAVSWIIQNNIEGNIHIKGDSQLVINQVKGSWKLKSDTSKRFAPQIKQLLQGRKITFEWIPREKNEKADILSNVAYKRYKNRAVFENSQDICKGA